MSSREFRPPEEKTSPVLFFVIGILMVAVTFWAVWDEIFTRRPWKNHQVEFNQIESRDLAAKLSKSREKFGSKIAKLDAKIAKSEASLTSNAEIAKLKEELARLKLEAFEKVQELSFTKANYGEAYFELNEGIRQGKDISAESKHANELRQKFERLKKPAESAEAARDVVDIKIKAKYQALENLRKQRQGVASEVMGFERRLEAIGKRTLDIKQIVLKAYERNNFNEPVLRADRCQSCHLGANRAGFEKTKAPYTTHPDKDFYLKKHDLAKIGCQSCHGGQGNALKTTDLAHGKDHYWEDKLLPKSEMESKCLACHSNVFNLERAPILSKGISLVRELGCYGCHNIPGTGDLRKRGPDLSRIQEKVNTGWLVSWIKRPRDYNPRTKMPYFSLNDRESKDIATYLWTAGARRAPSQKVSGMSDATTIAKGKVAFESVGCLGCHVRGAEDDNPGAALKGVSGRPLVIRNRDFAPALANVGLKMQPDWLVRWLKNPKKYWHETTMPNLRLSDSEATSITAYLFSLSDASKKTTDIVLDDKAAYKRGARLINRRGCTGCHTIPGMENASKIGPDLSSFSTKKVFELSFGNVVNTEHTWDAWTFAKLKNPKIYQTESEKLLMPNFDLSDEEARTIRTFLRGMGGQGPPHSVHSELDERGKKIELGRRMIEKYNCSGCHVIENWGGDILRRYKEKNNGPPHLNGVGSKIQPDWFYGFLNNVIILRPWLKVKMPSFQMPRKDTAALVDYFAALDGKMDPYVHFDKKLVTTESLKAGRELFHKAECFSCHGQWPPAAGVEPPSAVNLNYAKNRIRPEWILRWIQNPQKIVPGTKMPVYFEGAGVSASIVNGKLAGQDNRRWIYELTAEKEAELAEEQTATLLIGAKSIPVIVAETDEKNIKISSPENLGATFGRASITSHGEPIDPKLLDGDGLRQIKALRDFIMLENNFKKPSKTN